MKSFLFLKIICDLINWFNVNSFFVVYSSVSIGDSNDFKCSGVFTLEKHDVKGGWLQCSCLFDGRTFIVDLRHDYDITAMTFEVELCDPNFNSKIISFINDYCIARQMF